MKIFLTGATGYLGGAVLTELLEHGHEVTAHARTDESADALRGRGTDAVVGDLADRSWLTAQLANVDAVVHTASPNDATSAALDAAVLDAVLPAFAGTGRALVHTGGTWVHGSGVGITEQSPADPPPIVAWRPAVVERVRAAAGTGVRTSVIGPANLYGHGGGLPALVLDGPVTDGELLYPDTAHFANVHVDDVARLYRIALESAPAGSYFLAANAVAPAMADVAAAAARLRGLDGRCAPEPVPATRVRLGPLADALLLDQQVDASGAAVLGWHPSGPSLLDELSASGSYATAVAS